jgi:hypothetical protein
MFLVIKREEITRNWPIDIPIIKSFKKIVVMILGDYYRLRQLVFSHNFLCAIDLH